MKLNYKPIGNYIREIKVRNENNETNNLLGININKYYMPSVANIVGTDLSVYKMVKKGQFTCNRMHVGRDMRLPVALSSSENDFIVSPAYDVFEITDTNVLSPEYLMMWFTRSEFDRNAWSYTDADVRGGLSWMAFCEMELPIPSIIKQKEIVAEYNTIQNRIDLNKQLIQKLEETAQAIYKNWFIDFEFPDENGNPYKSNGGEMVESEMGEIPKGWRMSTLGYILEKKGYIRGPFGSALKVEDMQSKGIPVYEQQHVLDEHRNFRYFISDEKYNQLKRFSVQPEDLLISCSGVNLGKLSPIKSKDIIGIINQALLILRVNNQIIDPICVKYFLETKEGKRSLIQESGGSAQPNIAKREIIQSISYLLPSKQMSDEISRSLKIIDGKIENTRKLNDKLVQFKNLLLSKLATIEN